MLTSASTHPYYTSYRVVHNYLPVRIKGRAGGDAYLPCSFHSTWEQPNRDDNEGVWLFRAEHRNTPVNGFAHKCGHRGICLFSFGIRVLACWGLKTSDKIRVLHPNRKVLEFA